MFKRYFLLFGVNILIIAMVSIVMNLLGLGYYLTPYGINYESLMIFCLLWGMGGAFISLAISRWMAKKMMGVEIQSLTGQHGKLVSTVHRLAQKAKLSEMPEVGIYQSGEVNAFATGPSKKNSLVAVSTGLLSRMNQKEVEGVLAHEVAHIANGDMVTMTLLQGVMNAFVMFFARIAAFAVSQFLSGDDDEGEGLGFFAHMMVVFLFEIIFGILGSIVVAGFSRRREFKADAGGAYLAGKDRMIAALEALTKSHDSLGKGTPAMRSMQISSQSRMGMLLSTHPDLSLRIEKLKQTQ